MSLFLWVILIWAFIKSLENLDNLPIDSWGFTKDLHAAGINMKYIGLIAENTKAPHLKNICMIEMVARTCKKIYRHEMFSLISQFYPMEHETLHEIKSRLNNELI